MAYWTWEKPGTIEAKPQKRCTPDPWSGWPDAQLGLTFRQIYSAELYWCFRGWDGQAVIFVQGRTVSYAHKIRRKFQMLRQNVRILNLWKLFSKTFKKKWFERRLISLCKGLFLSVKEFESFMNSLLKLTNVTRNTVSLVTSIYLKKYPVFLQDRTYFLSSNFSKYWFFWCTAFPYIIKKWLILVNVDLWLPTQSGIPQLFTGH